MTTPGALLSIAIEGWDADLPTEAEREAMATDLHVLACQTPGGTCIECMAVFRAVRRYLKAAAPVVEAETRRWVAEEIGQAIEDCVERLGAEFGLDGAAYDHAAAIARFHARPDCGSEFHGAGYGPCPRCEFDAVRPVAPKPAETPEPITPTDT